MRQTDLFQQHLHIGPVAGVVAQVGVEDVALAIDQHTATVLAEHLALGLALGHHQGVLVAQELRVLKNGEISEHLMSRNQNRSKCVNYNPFSNNGPSKSKIPKLTRNDQCDLISIWIGTLSVPLVLGFAPIFIYIQLQI